jgi:hypothetical protein
MEAEAHELEVTVTWGKKGTTSELLLRPAALSNLMACSLGQAKVYTLSPR